MSQLASLASAMRDVPRVKLFGSVSAVRGTLIEVEGLGHSAGIGARLTIRTNEPGRGGERDIDAEITSLDRGVATCMPFSEASGLRVGMPVQLRGAGALLHPSAGWLGRVIDGLGRPIDGKGPLPRGLEARPFRAEPPDAARRGKVGGQIETGVRALDSFVPLCEGQRLGLFAGSGVGKSVLMSMIARWSEADVTVIGLIGERGREVQEFIDDQLGPEGLARSVVVVATSDSPALMRRQAAWTTLAMAEYFRDEGAHVLCMMDSVTRFAMAQREIGLAIGEPPASKGYTPSVFAELPRLLERAGPGERGKGKITGMFTVLVDGGDHDEPVADAVRGILDGHVVMDRAIAERGRFPAIDLGKSVSRTLPHCMDDARNATRIRALSQLATAADMEEMARLGAYQPGADPAVDRALAVAPHVEALINQRANDRGSIAVDAPRLAQIVEREAANA